MAWIPIYADEVDFVTIMERLNTDDEIAHIVSTGPNEWRACNALETICDGIYMVWHLPGGRLRSFKAGRANVWGNRLKQLFGVKRNMMEAAGWIKDPFHGWEGPHRADAENLPFLGSSPNIIELHVRMTGTGSEHSIGMSGFGWVANRYKAIGDPAANETMNWWRRLKNWVSKQSVERIPSSGPLDGAEKTVWAFPSAYDKIRNGMKRDLNPV